MPLDWNDLRVLLALERAGSLSGAAKEMSIDHSTVSRRLHGLEEALGQRLATRSGGCLVWSDAGQAALSTAHAIQVLVDELRRRADEGESLEGEVRISVPPGMSSFITQGLSHLRDTHPGLCVMISSAYASVDLRQRDADIALRMTTPTQPDLVSRQAFEVGWALFASADYVERRGLPSALGDFAGHDLILYAGALAHVPGPKWLEQNVGDGTVVMRADTTTVALQAVRDGTGIGVVPCFMAAGQTKLHRLSPEPVGSQSGFVVYHEDLRRVGRVRLVVDALITLLEKDSDLLRGDLV